MARPKPVLQSPAAPAGTPGFWPPFILAGLFGALAGGTFTYLALRTRLQPAAAPVASLPADPAAHLPSPALTAGQSPAQAARTLGNFYYDHQNWPLAVQNYESAISQGSDDADIRTDLGNAYRFSQRPDDALAQYQLAQRMNPAHEFSLFNQGGLYLEQMMQPGKAVAVWKEYLTRFPSGRNVAAARQLIAQTQGGGSALPSPTHANSPVSSAEELILQRIKSVQTTRDKP